MRHVGLVASVGALVLVALVVAYLEWLGWYISQPDDGRGE